MSAMMDLLQSCIGKKIVMDYRANNGNVMYAKGILKEVMEDKIVVYSKDELWIVDSSSVLNVKVTEVDDGGY